MRIALATSSYAPYFGGVEEHVRHVARTLRDDGHEVVVWTVARDGVFAVRDHEGVAVWDLPAPLPARRFAALARLAVAAPHAWRRWRAARRSFAPDVIHVHCFGPNGTYAPMVARASGVPLVVTSHGETIADDGGLFDQSWFARRSLTRAIAQATAVTAPSHVVLGDLEHRFGLAVGTGIVVPNGIDPVPDAVASASPVSGRYVACAGRLQKVKGFDLAVRAFAAADLPPDVRLAIGGDGPERDTLVALAAELGIGDRLVLPGRLDGDGIAALFAHALAVVVPSRFEAFGIVALEAWRAGAPLIATTHGGPPEFVRDGDDGLLVDPVDTAALAAALSRIVADEALRASLSRVASKRVASYAWPRITAQYERLYEATSAPGRLRQSRRGRRATSPKT